MANISDKTAQIRSAVLGKDVRESLASGIETINSEVESTTDRQTTLEVNMAAAEALRETAEAERKLSENDREEAEDIRVTEHTQAMTEVDEIKAAYDAATKANLSVEVSNARGTFGTLKGRLDNTDSQLSDNAKKMSIVTMLSDYNLFGDGIIDDSLELLRSFSNAIANKTTVFLEPNRIYLVTQLVQITGIKSLVVEGNNATIVFKNITDAITGMLTFGGDGTGNIRINNLNVINENVLLATTSDSDTGNLFNIEIKDFAKAEINNLNSYKAYRVGIQLSNLKSGYISASTVDRSSYAGIRLQGCENFTVCKNKVLNIYASNADVELGYGITCSVSGSYSYGTFGNNLDINIIDNRVYNVGRKNIDVHNCIGIVVKDNHCFNSSVYGGMSRTRLYGLIYVVNEGSTENKNTRNAIVANNILINESTSVAQNSAGSCIRIGTYSGAEPFGQIICSGNIIKNGHYYKSIMIDPNGLIDSVIIEGNNILSDSTRFTFSAIFVNTTGVEIPQMIINNNTVSINTGKIMELSNISNLISTGNVFTDLGTQSTNAQIYKLTNIVQFKRNNLEKLLGTTVRDSFTNVTEVA